MNRKLTEWEKICANDMTNKGLISYTHTHKKKTHTHIYSSYNSTSKTQITWLKNGQN